MATGPDTRAFGLHDRGPSENDLGVQDIPRRTLCTIPPENRNRTRIESHSQSESEDSTTECGSESILSDATSTVVEVRTSDGSSSDSQVHGRSNTNAFPITRLPSVEEIFNRRSLLEESEGDQRVDPEESPVQVLKRKRIIPVMPMPYALLCALFNFVLPGFGTFCSIFSMCCCNLADADSCPRRRRKKCFPLAVTLLIASCQLVLTPFFLIGWIWSCVWSFIFLALAEEYKIKSRERRALIQRMRNPVGTLPEPPPYSREADGDQLHTYGYSASVPTTPPPPYTITIGNLGNFPEPLPGPSVTEVGVSLISNQQRAQQGNSEPLNVSETTTTTVQVTSVSSGRTTNVNVRHQRNNPVSANFFRSENPYTRRGSTRNSSRGLTPIA